MELKLGNDMKITVIIFVFLIFMSGMQYVYANDAYLESRPRWEDVCPVGLEDSQYKEIQWFWPHSVRETQSEINYWARKRTQFEEQMDNCDILMGIFRLECYAQVNKKITSDFENHKIRVDNKKILNKNIDSNIYRMSSPIMIDILGKNKRRL